MILNRFSISAPFALFLCLHLIGCGKGNPPVGYVTGTVSLDGQPLEAGSVVFIPVPSGHYAQGKIKKDGTYTLTTFNEGDGALVGKHKIMVSAAKEVLSKGDPVIPLTPSKYSNEDTSGLQAEITKGKNTVNLELSSEKPEKTK